MTFARGLLNKENSTDNIEILSDYLIQFNNIWPFFVCLVAFAQVEDMP